MLSHDQWTHVVKWVKERIAAGQTAIMPRTESHSGDCSNDDSKDANDKVKEGTNGERNAGTDVRVDLKCEEGNRGEGDASKSMNI